MAMWLSQLYKCGSQLQCHFGKYTFDADKSYREWQIRSCAALAWILHQEIDLTNRFWFWTPMWSAAEKKIPLYKPTPIAGDQLPMDLLQGSPWDQDKKILPSELLNLKLDNTESTTVVIQKDPWFSDSLNIRILDGLLSGRPSEFAPGGLRDFGRLSSYRIDHRLCCASFPYRKSMICSS